MKNIVFVIAITFTLIGNEVAFGQDLVQADEDIKTVPAFGLTDICLAQIINEGDTRMVQIRSVKFQPVTREREVDVTRMVTEQRTRVVEGPDGPRQEVVTVTVPVVETIVQQFTVLEANGFLQSTVAYELVEFRDLSGNMLSEEQVHARLEGETRIIKLPVPWDEENPPSEFYLDILHPETVLIYVNPERR